MSRWFLYSILLCSFSLPVLAQQKDSIAVQKKQKDSVPSSDPSSAALTEKVSYKAEDYIRMNKITNKVYLHNQAEVNYGETQLKGGVIQIDGNTKNIHTGKLVDTVTKKKQMPFFKQGAKDVNPDSITFNYSSKRAYIWNSRTKEKNGTYVKSQGVKRVNDSIFYMTETKITTSKDVDNPEYYFRIRKGKMIGGKSMVAGLTNMYIADVPTPLGVPFAYIPLSNNSTSGMIFPTYGDGGNRGFFLQNGGYYLNLGNSMDMAITGDYYTNASYGFRIKSSYKKMYRYAGNVNFRYENIVAGERGFSNYSKSTVWNIQISHRKDQKAGPNSSFSASVNMGSSTYFRQSINQLNTPNFLNNTLSSSVSYSKTFPAYPAIRTSLTANHSQNNNTKKINMTLPTFQASMERIYPFASRTGIKKGLIKNINFQYTVNAQNRIETVDSLFFTAAMFNEAKNGVSHKIPLNTNFKVFKFFSVSMGTSFDEVWQFQTIKKNNYDPVLKEAKTDTIRSFDRFSKYSFSSNVGTTVYGTFNIGKDKKIQAIRHTMRPSIGLGYNPSQSEFYDDYISNAAGDTQEYTRFQGGFYGTPSKNESGSISMALANSLEAKVTDRDTTKIKPKKIKILNSMNFSTSYNMLADSLRWSPISMTASTALFKNKLSVNFTTSLDPYAITGSGVRINKFNINNEGSLFRMTRANIDFGYSISSSDFKEDKAKVDNKASGGREDALFGRAINNNYGSGKNKQKENDDSDKEDGYYRFKPTWKLTLRQSIRYLNSNRQNQFSANSLMFSGSLKPANTWNITFNSGFDFEKKGFTYTQINLEKDLKSWRLSFSWTPLNVTPTWYFFIGIKAGMFKDIKYEQRGVPDKKL